METSLLTILAEMNSQNIETSRIYFPQSWNCFHGQMLNSQIQKVTFLIENKVLVIEDSKATIFILRPGQITWNSVGKFLYDRDRYLD